MGAVAYETAVLGYCNSIQAPYLAFCRYLSIFFAKIYILKSDKPFKIVRRGGGG